MTQGNFSTIHFVGVHNLEKLNILIFTSLLMIYCVTVCGNLLIILLVSYSKPLHTPMYFFLTQLSIADIMLTTNISPNMMNVVLHEHPSISFPGCLTQYYFFGLSEVFECLLLTVMSYDRYLAICSPLHYASIMNQGLCIQLVLESWILSCCVALFFTLSIHQLNFCGPNTIDHFFCEFYALIELSCSDLSIVQLGSTLLGIPVMVLPFFVIVVSYIYIGAAIVKISSFSGRLKSFSTCSSHLTVVSIYYGTLIVMYALPNERQSQVVSKTLSLFYTVFIPFFNPFIYCLRNKVISEALGNVLYNKNAYFSKFRVKRL